MRHRFWWCILRAAFVMGVAPANLPVMLAVWSK